MAPKRVGSTTAGLINRQQLKVQSLNLYYINSSYVPNCEMTSVSIFPIHGNRLGGAGALQRGVEIGKISEQVSQRSGPERGRREALNG